MVTDVDGVGLVSAVRKVDMFVHAPHVRVCSLADMADEMQSRHGTLEPRSPVAEPWRHGTTRQMCAARGGSTCFDFTPGQEGFQISNIVAVGFRGAVKRGCYRERGR